MLRRALLWTCIPVLIVSLLSLGLRQAEAMMLAGSGSITGTVTTADGRPMPNAPVRLTQPMTTGGAVGDQGNQRPQSALDQPEATKLGGVVGKSDKVVKQTRTDAAGKFSFQGVAAGRYTVVAGSAKQGARQSVNVEEGKTVTLTLQVKGK